MILRHVVRSSDSVTPILDKSNFVLTPFGFIVFSIECSVPQSNGTNVPFTISSDLTLEQIHLMAAEKLDCFPDRLTLQYHLDSDKARTGPTSLQTNTELDMFITWM